MHAPHNPPLTLYYLQDLFVKKPFRPIFDKSSGVHSFSNILWLDGLNEKLLGSAGAKDWEASCVSVMEW
jgi:hypothetical protein